MKSVGLNEGTCDEVDGEGSTVLRAAAENRHEGGALAPAGAIQGAEADYQVAQACHVAWPMARADGGGILVEGNIADIVDSLDGPVTPPGGMKLGGVQTLVRSTGEDDLDVLAHEAGLQMMSGAEDDSGLAGVGKARLFGGDGERKDMTGLMSTVTLAQSDLRREKRLPFGRVWRVV